MYIWCMQEEGTAMNRCRIAVLLLFSMTTIAQGQTPVRRRKPVAAQGVMARTRDALLRAWARVTSVRDARMS